MSSNLHVPGIDYEVAELTWKDGQLTMHGLTTQRVAYKTHANITWDKPRAAETLETIVNQATLQPQHKSHGGLYTGEVVPWLDHHTSVVVADSNSALATMSMDTLVPNFGTQHEVVLSGANGARTACSTCVGSCSGYQSGFDQSGSGSGMESSRQLTIERGLGVKGLTSTSPEDSISGKRFTESTSPDEHDSVCHSRPQIEAEEKKKGKGKSSMLTKRSRAAAIHNQSERRRRDQINQRMKTLQKLVPNANKTDKASILDEVIEYLKQLQAQIQVMGRMNMSPMMMPLAMQQQQLQMAMMNPMGMGMGIGMPGVMDLNANIGSNRTSIPAGMSPVFHPSAFVQPMMPSWDHMKATGDRLPNHNDPMVAFLASQSQPMTMEGYSRMAALFQQMQKKPCYTGLNN